MKKTKKQTPKEGRKLSWWEVILIIIIILSAFDLWKDNRDYHSCVNKCINDNYYCLQGESERINDKYYILEYTVDMCDHKLNWCEIDCG
jgi:hypothetical protein